VTVTPVWGGSTDSLTHTFEADSDLTEVTVRFALTADSEQPTVWADGVVVSSTEVAGRWLVTCRTPSYEWADYDDGWYFLHRDIDGSRDVVETVVVL
jgi:hypothetical protein